MIRNCAAAATVLTLVLLIFDIATALSGAEAPEGARVDVNLLSGKTFHGTLLEVTPDSLVIDRGGGGSPLYHPIARFSRAEISAIRLSEDLTFLPLPSDTTLQDMLRSIIAAKSVRPSVRPQIDLNLESGNILHGALLDVTPDSLVIDQGGMRFPFYHPIASFSRSEISGIRLRGESAFSPMPPDTTLEDTLRGMMSAKSTRDSLETTTDIRSTGPRYIRVYKYDKLAFVGLTIAGGVFAGDRLSRASAKDDLADFMDTQKQHSLASSLRGDAKDARSQAYFGVAVGLGALVAACWPSHEDILVPSVSAENSGGVRVAFSIPHWWLP
ncbi:MAG: hypothetical protein V1694_01525 [Candidatus Eisenbacteria bacterium]